MTQTLYQPEKVCDSDSPEWKSQRMTGIGASEAAAACGVSKWSTPLELYHRKRGELPPIEDNRAMRLGRLLEPIIADEFQRETGLFVDKKQPGLFRHPDTPWILATPDAEIDSDSLLEIKTMNERSAWDELGEQYTDAIPHEWNLQAQQQMYVMGARVCWFAVLVGGQDLRIYEIQRHNKLIERLCGKVTRFWEMKESGIAPELLTGHRSNLELLRELYGTVTVGDRITLSESACEAWEEYENATKEAGKLKKIADAAKAEVLLELKDAEAGSLPDGRFVRRRVTKRKGYTVDPKEYVDVRAVKEL